mmetsp:Transcript_10288/g.39983  ORF Transcript_10288/g.39983 Transcript_10288/m.39983 type:complete len:205 (-) Transcript_10288:2023-2637(-)
MARPGDAARSSSPSSSYGCTGEGGAARAAAGSAATGETPPAVRAAASDSATNAPGASPADLGESPPPPSVARWSPPPSIRALKPCPALKDDAPLRAGLLPDRMDGEELPSRIVVGTGPDSPRRRRGTIACCSFSSVRCLRSLISLFAAARARLPISAARAARRSACRDAEPSCMNAASATNAPAPLAGIDRCTRGSGGGGSASQ